MGETAVVLAGGGAGVGAMEALEAAAEREEAAWVASVWEEAEAAVATEAAAEEAVGSAVATD